MNDLISREDAIKAVCGDCLREYEEDKCEHENECSMKKALVELPSAEADPKENHAQATGAKHVIKSLGTDSISHNGIDCTEFIYWLIEEVMDEEMWELNAVGNGEIICRKLKKLGLLEVKGGYYIRSSADRPKGHIVTKCSGKFNPTVWAECSECEKPIDAWDKFCRHCGADTRGEEE